MAHGVAPVKCINEVSNVTLGGLFAGGVGALGTLILSEISPLHGGIFCGVSALVALATKPIFMKLFAQRGANDASHALGFIFHIVVELGVSLAVWAALGLQISLIPIPLLIISQGVNLIVMLFYFDGDIA